MPDTPDTANGRQDQFLTEVFERGVVWVLSGGGGWFNWTEDGKPCIPVWSDPGPAHTCIAVSAPGYQAAAIALEQFVTHYLPQLADRGAWLAINPTADLCGNQLPAAELGAALQRAGATGGLSGPA